MKAKRFVAAGFAIHALLGSACLTPTAFADASPEVKVERMEMAMTPMIPMTPVHCDRCIRSAAWEQQSMDSACAGRCLATAADASRTMVAGTHVPFAHAASAPNGLIVSFRADVDGGFVDAAAPPGRFSPTRTVVLLL